MPRITRNPLSRNIARALYASLGNRPHQIKRRDFAKKIGVNYQTLGYWFQLENTVPVKHIVNVCKHLNDDIFTRLCINEIEKVIDSSRPDQTKYRYEIILRDLKSMTNKGQQMNPEDKAKLKKSIDDIRSLRLHHERWASLTPRQVDEVITHIQNVCEWFDDSIVNTKTSHSIATLRSFLRWIDK